MSFGTLEQIVAVLTKEELLGANALRFTLCHTGLDQQHEPLIGAHLAPKEVGGVVTI